MLDCLVCCGSSGEGPGPTRAWAGCTDYWLPLLLGSGLADVSIDAGIISLTSPQGFLGCPDHLEGSSLSSSAKMYLKLFIILTMLIWAIWVWCALVKYSSCFLSLKCVQLLESMGIEFTSSLERFWPIFFSLSSPSETPTSHILSCFQLLHSSWMLFPFL